MRRALVCATALYLACAGSVVAQKMSSVDDLDKTMKKAKGLVRNLEKLLEAGNVAEASAQLAVGRQAVADAQDFWAERNTKDAVQMSRDSVGAIDALAAVLSSSTYEPDRAAAALKAVGDSCRACHDKYRAEDADGNYTLKAGVVSGS